MARTNPQRRQALLDAAIDTLADRGARGLTFRAVDEVAGVPAGTASNYFADRVQLLTEAGEHLFTRLAPDPDEVAGRFAADHDRDLYEQLMQDILRRSREDRRGYLAMLELRLEATRRPEIRASMTRYYRANLDGIVATHVEEGFPGDAKTAVLMYLAMTGLLVETLTLPGVVESSERAIEELVGALVTTIVPHE